jgi:hypothetical protein
MSRYRLSLAAALAATLTLAIGAAQAADRKVLVTNKTTFTIVAFQASSTGVDNWQENIFGGKVLEPGSEVTINIDDGSGACHFDFLATFEDKTTAEKHDVNVCEVGQFDFTE